MKNIFNKSFYRFTIGFVGILFASFALAAAVSHIEASKTMPASVGVGK
ncbi:MAG: hypothetical protein KBD24_01580 [Candidatus Pacebacteria bacterium]|nr:hypothetical protein [Candidatus Paceibacterota bacterium]